MPKCDLCGSEKAYKSRNPLAKDVCAACIVKLLDTDEANTIRLISQTLHFPFNLNDFYAIKLTNRSPEEAMDIYLSTIVDKPVDNESTFAWDEIDHHYQASKNFTVELAKLMPLREAIQVRGATKWGHQYSFQEIIELESQYESAVRQNGITSSIQKEALKNLVRISVKMKGLIEAGEYKELRDATASYQQFLKAAKLEAVEASKDENVIRTVADLALFMEKNGFEFHKLLPVVPKDEIDFLMDDFQAFVKTFVYNSTGIDQDLRDQIDLILQEKEEEVMDEVSQTMALVDDIENDWHDEENLAFIQELELDNPEIKLDEDGEDPWM